MTQQKFVTVVLSVFCLAMLIFLMLFVLLAFGKIILTNHAISALAYVMAALIKLIVSLVNRLGTISEVKSEKPL